MVDYERHTKLMVCRLNKLKALGVIIDNAVYFKVCCSMTICEFIFFLTLVISMICNYQIIVAWDVREKWVDLAQWLSYLTHIRNDRASDLDCRNKVTSLGRFVKALRIRRLCNIVFLSVFNKIVINVFTAFIASKIYKN